MDQPWTEDSVARTLINPNYCLTDPPIVTERCIKANARLGRELTLPGKDGPVSVALPRRPTTLSPQASVTLFPRETLHKFCIRVLID